MKLKQLFEQYDDEYDDGVLYVYDSSTQDVTELDTNDELAMQRFNNNYNFHADSLSDIPEVNGVRVFQTNGRTVVVGSSPVNIAAEVERLSMQ